MPEEQKKLQKENDSGFTKPFFIHFQKVINYPYTSEKAESLQKLNQYVFLVDKSANKKMIQQEIQRRFNVKVKSVNIILERKKPKHFGNRFRKGPLIKKAIVSLKTGEKINISPTK